MYRMERLVPAVGATVAGPLGLVHLPRMWLKGVLSAAAMLWEGYFDDYKGFNQFVSDRIGLDPEQWFAYLKTMPTYAEAERWVRANATKTDPASIAAANEYILTFLRPEENAARVRDRVGIADTTFRNSALLINVDDWYTIHDELLAHKDEGIEPVIPSVSSSQTGLLGVMHLPRLWMKALLTGVKALPQGWNSGFGFDKRVADTVGFDLDEACAYIHAELPHYLVFEQWVADRVGPVTDAKRSEWNAAIRSREKPEDKAAEERAEAGVPEMSHRAVIMLNDMVDWQYLHAQAVERAAAKA
jgi:hypothetical protein